MTTQRTPYQWTTAAKIDFVSRATGCSAQEAFDYLVAEEGIEIDAIRSYHADHPKEAT